MTIFLFIRLFTMDINTFADLNELLHFGCCFHCSYTVSWGRCIVRNTFDQMLLLQMKLQFMGKFLFIFKFHNHQSSYHFQNFLNAHLLKVFMPQLLIDSFENDFLHEGIRWNIIWTSKALPHPLTVKPNLVFPFDWWVRLNNSIQKPDIQLHNDLQGFLDCGVFFLSDFIVEVEWAKFIWSIVAVNFFLHSLSLLPIDESQNWRTIIMIPIFGTAHYSLFVQPPLLELWEVCSVELVIVPNVQKGLFLHRVEFGFAADVSKRHQIVLHFILLLDIELLVLLDRTSCPAILHFCCRTVLMSFIKMLFIFRAFVLWIHNWTSLRIHR